MASHFDQHALNNAPPSDAAFEQDLQAEQPQEVMATRPPTGFDMAKFLRKRYGMPRLSDMPRGKALWMALLQEVKDNWKSGITVALVNVPLSISLAVASDADPVMGIVTAVWAVLFGAPLAGSNYNIVGPTGALSGLLSAYSIRYGESVLPLLALLSGLMSLVVFFFRLDRFFSLIPNAVTHGFTVGVAFIIGLNQLASALGLVGLKRHESFLMNMYEIFSHVGETNGWAVVTFIIFLTALLTLARKFPKIPWVIVMCTIGIIIGALIDSGNWFFTVQTLHSKYPTLDLVLAKIPDFEAEMFNLETIFAASSVTLIAVLETLISAKIADRMTETKHDRAREVLGVALANLGCGIFGGLPATAALARTALNIKSGATSRMSTIINGVMVMIIAVGLLSLFKYLMMPTVAAVLVVVAIRMVDPKELHHLWERDKTMAGIAFLTALLCVVLEPTTGIVIGAMIALLFFALQSGTGYGDVSVQRGHEILYSKSIYEIDALTNKLDVDQAAVPRMEEFEAAGSAGACLVYRITGSIVYLNAESHLERVLSALQDYTVVVMSLDSLYFLDIDGMEMLGDVANACTKGNKELVVAGVSNVVLEDLARLPWFVERQQKGMVFASTHEALEYLEHADQMGESGAVYGSAHTSSVQYYDAEEPNVQPASMNDDEANYP